MIVDLTEKLGEKGEEKLKIELTRDKDFFDELPRDAEEGTPSSSWINLAVVTTFDDPRFAQENGSLGFWKPLTFLRDVGLGLYFLEPYDAEKVPVLFVHGANGTPEGWGQVIENLIGGDFSPGFIIIRPDSGLIRWPTGLTN